MALPVDNRQFGNVLSTTLDAKLARLVDNVFTSNPLFVRLHSRGAIKHEGGDTIQAPFIYDKMPGGSYQRGDTFDTSNKEFITQLVLQWKQNYASFAMYGIDMAKNQGAMRIINLVDSAMETAKMTLADNLGSQLFGDGTGNGGADLDGLRVAVDNSLAYGGVTRDTSAQGSAIKAQVNTTGGAFSLPMVNTSMGTATFANEKPDLIITDQVTWNKMWERVQPQQRFASEDLKKVGMDAIQFNGADVVVDSHCPAGTMYGLNTKYLEFWILSGFDFKWRLGGGMPVYNQDSIVDQIIVYANLVCPSPRMHFRIDNIS